MEIVHIAAELAPLAKVGGLGDCIYGLARAFKDKDNKIEVILPKYDTLNLSEVENLHVFLNDLPSPFEGERYVNTIWKGQVHGIAVTFIDSHDPYHFFKRGKIYGCPDDLERFAYFTRAALEYLQQCKRDPDIIHIHDWHTSLAAPLIKKHYPRLGKVILTIHNMLYRGVGPAHLLRKIGLDAPELKDGAQINLLRGGIIFCDAVTTVSPTYAKEILSDTTGDTLCALLREYRFKFKGVINGIDYEYWNPQTDPYLSTHYNAKQPSGKKKAQKELRELFSLQDKAVPLVGCVTRLVAQKGPELIKQALFRTLERGGQFVLIGSAHEEETEKRFQTLKQTMGTTAQAHIGLTYDEKWAHLVFAAADIMVVPSIFEPCGLTQMIAMRYGALPLVRHTGGLADTVADGINGFSFLDPTAESISKCLDRAYDVWESKREIWDKMVDKAMQEDFSWKVPAQEYLVLYNSLLKTVV